MACWPMPQASYFSWFKNTVATWQTSASSAAPASSGRTPPPSASRTAAAKLPRAGAGSGLRTSRSPRAKSNARA